MPNKHYVYEDQDGVHSYFSRDVKLGPPDFGYEVPRLPEAGEKWNKKAKKFEVDDAGLRDITMAANHRQMMHLRKSIEASLIEAGHDLPNGLLAQEAAETKVPLAELVSQVVANDAPLITLEVARRVAKVKTQG